MAVNSIELINNIDSFIDFSNRSVLIIGAGGGQLVGYAANAKQIIAVDNDENSINQLRERVSKTMLKDKYSYIVNDFFNVTCKADILVFEFSLHEIPDIKKAIEHGKELAPQVIVFDHCKESEWLYIVQEEGKIENEDNILEKMNVKKAKQYSIMQSFNEYEDLKRKVVIQGEESIKAIHKYITTKNIEIDMKYKLVEI
jgi:SAM-dependent methyltransferase